METDSAKQNDLKVVTQWLGNTPTVCRSRYVHPEIFALHTEGTLAPALALARARARPTSGLSPAEAKVLALLRRR